MNWTYLNLIAIKNRSKNGFAVILKKLRSKAKSAPSLNEITGEVELVRMKRHESKEDKDFIVEIDMRLDGYKSGKVETLSWEEVKKYRK